MKISTASIIERLILSASFKIGIVLISGAKARCSEGAAAAEKAQSRGGERSVSECSCIIASVWTGH